MYRQIGNRRLGENPLWTAYDYWAEKWKNFGKLSPDELNSIIDQAARDNQRASGGRLTYEQSRAIVARDITGVNNLNNQDTDALHEHMKLGGLALMVGALAVGTVLVVSR